MECNAGTFANSHLPLTMKKLPKFVVVSLPDAVARRDHIAREFARFPGLNFEFFDAVRIGNKREFPPDYDHRKRKLLFGDDLRPGEVGCFISHRTLWQRCAAAGDEAWCILEDDIVLHDNFLEQVSVLMHHRDRWDIVRLMQLLRRRGSWPAIRLGPASVLRAYDRQPSGAQGYLLTPAAARQLAEHASRIVWPVDETMDLYWEHKLRMFSVEPAAIGLAAEDFGSTIGDRSSSRRPKWRKLQRQLINGLQGVRRKLHNLKVFGLHRPLV